MREGESDGGRRRGGRVGGNQRRRKVERTELTVSYISVHSPIHTVHVLTAYDASSTAVSGGALCGANR